MATPPWKRKAKSMARAGKSISKIAKEVGVDYSDVWGYVRNVQGTEFASWQGAKRIVNNRLKDLVDEEDPGQREHLTKDVIQCVNYLYKEARRLSRKIEGANKASDQK